MPAMALRGMVLFPGNIMHFDVGRDQSIRAVESALESGSNLFVVAQRTCGWTTPPPTTCMSTAPWPGSNSF